MALDPNSIDQSQIMADANGQLWYNGYPIVIPQTLPNQSPVIMYDTSRIPQNMPTATGTQPIPTLSMDISQPYSQPFSPPQQYFRPTLPPPPSYAPQQIFSPQPLFPSQQFSPYQLPPIIQPYPSAHSYPGPSVPAQLSAPPAYPQGHMGNPLGSLTIQSSPLAIPFLPPQFPLFTQPQVFRGRKSPSSSSSNGGNLSSGSKGSPTMAVAGTVTSSPTPVQREMTKMLEDHTTEMRNINLIRNPHSKYVRNEGDPKYRLLSEKMQVTPKDYWEGVARAIPKTFRQPAMAKVTSQLINYDWRKQYYQADEIMFSGALQCQPCRRPDLQNPVLNIFRFENFNSLEQTVYDFLLPALRLASRWMTDKRTVWFWATLLHGIRDHDVATSTEFARGEKMRGVVYPVSDEQYQQILEYFDKLAEHIDFDYANTTYGDSMVYAYHINNEYRDSFKVDGLRMLYVPGQWNNSSTDPWKNHSHIRIHKDFLTQAQKFVNTRHRDHAQVLRFYFFMACNITHEVAHAFEAKCSVMRWRNAIASLNLYDLSKSNWHQDRHLLRAREAVFPKFDYSEMGDTWEEITFGGKMRPINDDISTSKGLCVVPNAHSPAQFGQPDSFAVPMGYVEELQQETFWERPYSATVPPDFQLLIPASCAVEMERAGVPAQSWRDYLRERDEEKREQFEKIQKLSLSLRPTKRVKADTDPLDRPKKPLPQPGSLLKKTLNEVDFADELLAAEKERKKEEADSKRHERFVPPESGQTDLSRFVHFQGSGDSSSSGDEEDPAMKKPEKLTYEDKWLLTEEYMLLGHGVSEDEFLAARTLEMTVYFHNPSVDPNNPDSWRQVDMNNLKAMRAQAPTVPTPIEKGRKQRDDLARRKDVYGIWTHMEELAVRMGYSRIEFLRDKVAGRKLPMDMKMETWNGAAQTHLDYFRFFDTIMRRNEYRDDLRSGKAVLPLGLPGVAAIADLRGPPTPALNTANARQALARPHTITYKPVAEQDPPEHLYFWHKDDRFLMQLPSDALANGFVYVGDLRKYAAEKIDVDPGRLRLLFRGKTLRDDEVPVKYYGVRDASTIQCIQLDDASAASALSKKRKRSDDDDDDHKDAEGDNHPEYEDLGDYEQKTKITKFFKAEGTTVPSVGRSRRTEKTPSPTQRAFERLKAAGADFQVELKDDRGRVIDVQVHQVLSKLTGGRMMADARDVYLRMRDMARRAKMEARG